MTEVRAPSSEILEVDIYPRTVAGLRERVTVAGLPAFFARALPAVAGHLAGEGMTPAGPPTTVYDREVGDTFEVLVGFPVSHSLTGGALVRLRLPGGRAVQAVHAGPYASLPASYERLHDWFAVRGLQPPGRMWEEYLVGPERGSEDGCLTRIVLPLE